MRRVRPGVFDVIAILFLANALSSVDLPTLLLPIKQNSVFPSIIQLDLEDADLMNSIIFYSIRYCF
jgi:hypothetical protein